MRKFLPTSGLGVFVQSAMVLAGAAATPAVDAQSLTGAEIAQELQRQMERERVLREAQERTPDVRLQAPEAGEARRLPEGETPCFPLREIAMKPGASEFGWALSAADEAGDPARDRCLGTRGINAVMARVQNAIIARGYVTTRVLAEPQDLQSGKLTLSVVPGRIREVRVAAGSDRRANLWNALPMKAGELLNLRDLEQGLENLKRLPTAEADVQIVPAEAPGESDVVVAWKQAFPLRLSLAANDAGVRSTGRYQGSITIAADHLLALNDLFYATGNSDLGGGMTGERGTRGHVLHYSLPFAYWTFSVTASANRYHQSVAGASQTYVYRGSSENYEARLSRIIQRDGTSKTSASIRGYLSKSGNFIDDTEIEVQRRRMAGWEASLNHRRFFADSTLDLGAAYRHGTGAFKALHAPEESFDEGTARPRIVSADATLSAPVRIAGLNLRYTGSWRAQWNLTPLVPMDRFSIGGRHSVRGFDGESVLMADRGWLMRNELGVAFGDGTHAAYLGLDRGHVGGTQARLLIGRDLSGAVVGLRGSIGGLAYDVFVGQPLSRPAGFRTARTTAGFEFNFSF